MSRVNLTFVSILLCVIFTFAGNAENTSAFNKFMSPEGGINPLSGTVAFQKEIGTISVGQVKADFSLKYSGNVFEEAKKSNDEVKSGLVGLGWSFGRAKIVCDCKNNSFLGDDDYYLITAEGNRYKIFEETAWRKHFNVGYTDGTPEKWWVEGNPFWKVERFVEKKVLPEQGSSVWSYVKGWKITDAEGIVHTYGDIAETNSLTGPDAHATEYDLIWLQYQEENGGWQPAYGLMETAYGGTPSYYPVAWNLSKEEALDGSFLKYDYEQISENLFGYFKWNGNQAWSSIIGYTKETYLTGVTASNNAQINFFYENKGEDIFFGEINDDEGENETLSDDGLDMYREKFSRKFLSRVETYKPGKKDPKTETEEEKKARFLGKVTFCYTPLQPSTPYIKRLLSAIHFFNQAAEEIDYEEYSYYTNPEMAKPSYSKEYSYPLGALYAIKGKECGWVEYSYKFESMGNGHVEELPLDYVYGQGRLEDGTTYIVGRKDEYTYNQVGQFSIPKEEKRLKIYTRILGRWVESDLLDEEGKPILDIDEVQFGDAGWFMAVKNESKAMVFQWNGKEWQRMISRDLVDKTGVFERNKVDFAVAGPDYAFVYRIHGSETLKITFFWTKWTDRLDSINLEVPDEIKLEGTDDNMDGYRYKIVPLKNHFLVQFPGTWCSGNCLGYYVYTFKDGHFKGNKTIEKTGKDTDNNIYLNGSFLYDVGEADHWYDNSRVMIYAWNGHKWNHMSPSYEFSNSDEANIEAFGKDYFAVRYNGKRHLRIFAFKNNIWDGNAYHEKFFNWQMSSGFEWTGYGSTDFLVTTSSYRKHWYNSVQKNKRLKVFYSKNGAGWNVEDYGRLDGFEGDAKQPIVGTDWFVEKNASRRAWIWRNNQWETEELSGVGYLSKSEFPDSDEIRSLGGNLIVASKEGYLTTPGKTRLIYKVKDSFLNAYGSYLVRSKQIFEPVADRSVVYGYSFMPNENAKGAFAFDDATNTPLMDVMKVEIMKIDKDKPAAKGIVERQLCDLLDGQGKESVAVGSVCQEIQWSMNQSSKISHTKTYFERKRYNWPYPVYLDQEVSKVEVARGLKTVVTNEYSENNGMLKKKTRKIGNRQTVENYVFVADLDNSDGNGVVNELKGQNRLNVLAGSYSCIPNCSDKGSIVAASANGLSKNKDLNEGKLSSVTSSWKFIPKAKVSESNLKANIKSIALNSTADSNWERQSLSSKFSNKHIVETVEGPRNIKTASFYENSELGKKLGNVANCGIDESLMLSGETCNIENWENCDIYSLKGSAKDAIGLPNDQLIDYGRFSSNVIKLTSANSLIGTIQNAKNEEYTFTAWLQYGAENGTLSLSVNGSTVSEGSWEIRPSSLPQDSVGKWKMIEWKGTLTGGKTTIALSVQNISTFARLQDIRFIPSTATSTTTYWNPKWEKIETSVDSRGVASYVDFDKLGRESKHFAETSEGEVYLSSKTTYFDGNCTTFADGSDVLTSLRFNEQPQKLPVPGLNGERKASYMLTGSKIYIDFTTLLSSDGVKFKLYPEGENEPEQWESPNCGSLCYPSFLFAPDKMSWILKIDVQPYSKGVYEFNLKKRENDWIEYGAFDGFANGNSPRYVNDFDSSYVVFKVPSGTLNENKFDGNVWRENKEIFTDNIAEFDVFSGAYGSILTYISVEEKLQNEYPKVFKKSATAWNAKNLGEKDFRADNVKLAETSSGTPILFYNKNAAERIVTNPNKPSETHLGFVNVNALSAKKWNESKGVYEDFGSLPVLVNNTFSLDNKSKTVSFQSGTISSYVDGRVSENEALSLDAVAGPEGKFYVAYVGTSSYFNNCGENGNEPCDAPFVYVKRLYETSEVQGISRDIWAGVSMTDGAPLYQGDILSWSENIYDAIGGVNKLKLASDGNNLYLAVSYELPDEDENINENSSSSSQRVTSSSLSTGSLLNPTHALSVFKGSIRKNYVVNGKTYSSYLKWEPLKDLSIKATFMAKNVQEEQIRIAYMDENDDFDFAVRNSIPYLMFRNKDNDDAISVISFTKNQWLPIGNPGFAYPNVSKSSADLGVNNNGNPFVVFRAKDSKENIGRANKIVGMHYNSKNAKDLTLLEVSSTDANFNKTCAFRPYILHYIANLDNVDNFVFNVKFSKPGDVKEILVAVNGNIKFTITDFSQPISVPLEKGENKLEVRVVGNDGSTLSYRFDLYRYYPENPNFYTVGLMANVQTGINIKGTMVIGVEPKVTQKNGTVQFDVHFEAGWTLVLVINGKKVEYDVASTVEIPVDALPLTGGYIYNKDGSIIPVEIHNIKIPIDNPNDYPWYLSSSSNDINNSSSSSDINQNQSSSSSSVLNKDMSDNVPDEIRNLTTAHLFASHDVNVADRVHVKGDAFSGNDAVVGADASVDGDVYSGKSVVLRNRAHVENVHYGVTFNVQDGASYESSTHLSSVNVPAIPTFNFISGENNVLIEQSQQSSMIAGTYKDFTARTGVNVIFSAGDYYFRNFYTDSRVNLNFTPGTRIWIGGDLRIGNDCKLWHLGQNGDLFVYVNGGMTIETNADIRAVLVAPNASGSISTGTKIHGYVIGKSLNIQPNAIIE